MFLVRRERICNTRRISSSRPITGSSLPLRAISLRFMAYLPNALNSCCEVCESTVAPLRNSRMAATKSFSVAPLRFSISDAAPRSATRPNKRCSTEAYLSLNVRVKSTARWIVFDVSVEKYCSPLPPETFGRASMACCNSLLSIRTFTPTRPSKKFESESSSFKRAISRCCGSTACCPASRARVTADCRASCALIVSELMFIV